MSDSEDSTALPSLDYVPGSEYPPSPDFVPEPVYPEFMPSRASLPTADLPDYVPESDPEEDPEEDDDEDPEEDHTDGGDDGDDEDESSDDDEDDDVDIEDDEEEEEHPTPADSAAVALPAVDHALSAEETEPFKTDESAAIPPLHPAYQVTAMISIRDEPPTPFWSDTKVARLLAIPTPPPSPLSLWSSPLPQIPSPPLPLILSPLLVSPPLPVSSPPPASTIHLLGYRAVMIRLRAKALSTFHSLPLPPPIILSHTRSDAPSSGTPPLLPIPAPTSLPPLLLPSTNRREDKPEVTLPPQKRLCIALGLRYEVGERSSAAAARLTGGSRADYDFFATMDREMRRNPKRYVGYGITDTWDEIHEDMPAAPMTDDTYMLYRDRRAHARTGLLIEREDRMSREAWGRSMDASNLARLEVMSLRTTVLGQQAVITELQAADRKRQAVITELLAADCRRQAQFIEALKLLKRLQTQMTKFESQQGPVKGPAQPDAPEEAGSSS
ncbi:hypothetical protein Tco_0991488 [Tanacetum coccineum]|uniref:Uncharacterized protein n=1 Tax=Tanacetum coccineum TaxID=301880 RepID=A0ABQ5F0G6_9ASTR